MARGAARSEGHSSGLGGDAHRGPSRRRATPAELGPWDALDAALHAALTAPVACPFCGDAAPEALGELILSLAVDGPVLDGGCPDCGTPLPRRSPTRRSRR